METGHRRAWRQAWMGDFALFTAIGVFLGLVGPYGSFLNGSLWRRMVFWVGLAWLGRAVFGTAIRLVLARVRAPRRIAVAVAVTTLVVSVPFSWVSWVAATWLWPFMKHVPGMTPWLWYLEGALVTAPQVALFTVLRRRRQATAPPLAAAAAQLGVPSGEVLCLQMEDHYVRVHTAAGSRMVLATMAQAIEALERAPGLRVHRSWWVAERALAEAVWEGRNLRLRLTNGLSAPVARTAVAAVRQAGWLGEGATTTTADSTAAFGS